MSGRVASHCSMALLRLVRSNLLGGDNFVANTYIRIRTRHVFVCVHERLREIVVEDRVHPMHPYIPVVTVLFCHRKAVCTEREREREGVSES